MDDELMGLEFLANEEDCSNLEDDDDIFTKADGGGEGYLIAPIPAATNDLHMTAPAASSHLLAPVPAKADLLPRQLQWRYPFQLRPTTI